MKKIKRNLTTYIYSYTHRKIFTYESESNVEKLLYIFIMPRSITRPHKHRESKNASLPRMHQSRYDPSTIGTDL